MSAINQIEDKIKAFQVGGVDYITKPFGVSVLLARVSAVLRRISGLAEEVPADQGVSASTIILGQLEIYPERYEVSLGGQSINLRPKEFEVLLYLARKPGVVLTRDDLMNAVWGFDYIGGQRTVDVHVSSLRKKLELDPEYVHIDSIRGVGYKLVVNKKRAPVT